MTVARKVLLRTALQVRTCKKAMQKRDTCDFAGMYAHYVRCIVGTLQRGPGKTHELHAQAHAGGANVARTTTFYRAGISRSMRLSRRSRCSYVSQRFGAVSPVSSAMSARTFRSRLGDHGRGTPESAPRGFALIFGNSWRRSHVSAISDRAHYYNYKKSAGTIMPAL